jgi:hypothetical protein
VQSQYGTNLANLKLIKPCLKKAPQTNRAKSSRQFSYLPFGFHVQLIALPSQANTHGALLVSGLQEEQVYFIFFLCSSATEATVLSSRSINMVSSWSADRGHALTHLPQPLHLSVSIVM